MRRQIIETYTLPNGLTLVVEPMPAVQSAAFALMVPSGSIYDPPGKNGNAAVLCDLLVRGAGERDSKALASALDNLGVQRNESVGTAHLTLSGATLADNLEAALRIYADIVRRPHLPHDQFSAAKAGVEQTLLALEDEPRQKIIQELRRRCYDAPWGWPNDGDLDQLDNITPQSVREQFERCFRPDETVLGIAGNIDPRRLRDLVEELFGDWPRKEAPELHTGPHLPAIDHIEHDSTQVHIGVAYRAVPYRHEDYYAAWAAVSILSGGMSSRLFTEVREKRGLCYSVYASLNSLKDDARVLCYAGTTAERAQETLDVVLAELVRLGEGIGEDELDRCKARAKSSLIMQQESTMARSSSIARDWYHLGRVNTLDEVHGRIEALTTQSVLDYVHAYPARDFTVLTIGPQALEVPERVP